jgi:hypothetical protein
LGYGYLDSWHGIATMPLMPFYITGLIRSYGGIKNSASIKNVFAQSEKITLRSPYGIGKLLLLIASTGMFLAGLTIMVVGMTTVFVPQDLVYMDITVCGIDKINSNLKPLIAHDRAAFGRGLSTIGLLYFFIIRRATPVINLWQIVATSMLVGFASAIGVHFMIGYKDMTHLLPAYMGAAISFLGLMLTYSRMKAVSLP